MEFAIAGGRCDASVVASWALSESMLRCLASSYMGASASVRSSVFIASLVSLPITDRLHDSGMEQISSAMAVAAYILLSIRRLQPMNHLLFGRKASRCVVIA